MKKIISCFLVLSMAAGMITMTACNESKNKTKVVTADSTWFSTEKIDVSKEAITPGNNYQKVYFNYVGMVGQNYCCNMFSDLYVPKGTEDTESKHSNELLIIGEDGKITNRINLYDYIEADTDTYSEYFNDFVLENEVIKGYVAHYDKNTYQTAYSIVEINPMDGDEISRVAVDISESGELGSISDIYQVCNRRIASFTSSNAIAGKSTINLQIEDLKTKKIGKIKMSDYFPEEDLWGIDSVLEYSENEVLLFVHSGDDIKCISLNLNDLTMEDICPDGIDWMGKISPGDIVAQDGKFYVIDKGSILECDFLSQTLVPVFDFSLCNINQFDISSCKLEKFTDDEIFLSCRTNDETTMYSGITQEFFFYRLTRNTVNPNAGKIVLEVGTLTGLSRPVAEAISVFNDTNEEFIIQINNSYNVVNHIDKSRDDIGYESAYNNALIEFTDKMSIDLLSGNGPDIIIDGSGFGQINNGNCFVDLSDYVAQLDTSDYFTNVFDGSRVDGKLYQLPLVFNLQCIITGESNVDSDQNGFTFDEYNQFVNGICNGIDPINFDRNTYFCTIINSMSDMFMDNGTYNYNNEAFKMAASYAKDNVMSCARNTDDVMSCDLMAHYSSIGGYGLLIAEYSDWQTWHKAENIRLLGIPSSDGRGPSVAICSSVGISAQSSNPDACWEFVKVLLGKDVQTRMAKGFKFPVNCSSYDDVSEEMTNRYNWCLDNNISYSFGPSAEKKIDASFAGNVKGIISHAHVSADNLSINTIIQEEIQPYFVGDKTIDEVVQILQDRVNTVENERK